MEKNHLMYPALLERIRTEWIVYALAFVFIMIADSSIRIRIPFGREHSSFSRSFTRCFWAY